MLPNLLHVKDLAVLKGDELLFSGVSFTAEAGSIWRIHGANGAGKTTLLRAILGLTRMEAGEVQWQGIPTRDDASRFREACAYVGHLPPLKPALTAAENVHFNRLGYTASGLSDDEALHRVGMLHKADVMARHLSAGQRRRVALASLLTKQVSLWVLDEPLTGLDTDGQQLVCELMKTHCEAGNIVIFTAHQAVEIAGHHVHGVQLS